MLGALLLSMRNSSHLSRFFSVEKLLFCMAFHSPLQWPVMFLIGNKTDLEFRRTVKVEKHTVLAAQHSIEPHYTSAKTADAVLLVFR